VATSPRQLIAALPLFRAAELFLSEKFWGAPSYLFNAHRFSLCESDGNAQENESLGNARINGANGMSDVEGRAARVAANVRGQRASFNGAGGISDIEGKATRVGASKQGGERISIAQ